jgi:hypothetical protein
MHTLSKQKGWTPFNMLRTAFCLLSAVGLSLTSLVILNPDKADSFAGSSWMLPTITIAYFAVLIVTHLPHPNFAIGNFGRGAYKGVESGKLESDETPLKDMVAVKSRESEDTMSPPLHYPGTYDSGYGHGGHQSQIYSGDQHPAPDYTSQTGHETGYTNTPRYDDEHDFHPGGHTGQLAPQGWEANYHRSD